MSFFAFVGVALLQLLCLASNLLQCGSVDSVTVCSEQGKAQKLVALDCTGFDASLSTPFPSATKFLHSCLLFVCALDRRSVLS